MSETFAGRSFELHRPNLNDKGKPLFPNNRIKTSKYNVLTFLPKNLFEQFSRIANFYFLLIVILLNVPGVPISATVAAIPLVLVVGISAVREAIEDYRRHLSDVKINSTLAHKLSYNQFIDIKWEDILVGDIIKVYKNEQIPADIVLISTSDLNGMAFIDTCNLDGETNLKVKQAMPFTAIIKEPTELEQFHAKIDCDAPNNMLYTFNGCLTANIQYFPLDDKQVLLRGCILRNIAFAIGITVYTGKDTKIMMNSSESRVKKSKLERGLNFKLISILAFIGIASFTQSIIGVIFQNKQVITNKHWYFFYNERNQTNRFVAWVTLFISCIVIINATIPISLYVTLEIVRVAQAIFVSWDAQLYDKDSQTSAVARTSNISDDLGQVEYVFSDKTGTLTQNIMEFMKCSIAGEVYGSGITEVAYSAALRKGETPPPLNTAGKAFHDERFNQLLENNPPSEIKDFLWLLSTCHSVIAEADSTKNHGISFNASSPDEAALVEAAADLGYTFTSRTPNSICINVNGCPITIELLSVLEFSSSRKRSSVIIRHPETNKIILFCKGADDLILQRLSPQSKYIDETKEHLKQFAADGLRTLCCAYKIIEEEEYSQWAERFNEASCSIQNHDESVELVCNEIESNLFILGATAIEDKLQVGVSNTIDALLRAKVNVWIITGDKQETAINIGYACSLLNGDMKLIILEDNDPDKLIQIIRDVSREAVYEKLAMIATGTALFHLLSDQYKDEFYEFSQRCKSVICCRVSPLQKATIVEIMREKSKKITLAVGDGANDVGMIQKADIGIGISGKEGRQAVLASDYAIGQFRFLKRLLCVHGRLSFYRNIELINYSFYKNMVFSLNQVFFAYFNYCSGNTVYDSVSYTIYNVVFTSVPIVVYSIFERDVKMESMMTIPELYYVDGRREWLQSPLRFWMEILLGIIHAGISFYIPYYGMWPFVDDYGHSLGLKEFGITVYGCVVLIVNLRIAAICTYWTVFHHLAIWLSIIMYPIVVLIIDGMGLSMEIKGVSFSTLTNSHFYFSIIGTAVIAIIPVVAYNAISNSRNTITNRVLHIERHPIMHKDIRTEVAEFIPPPPEPPKSEDYPLSSGYNFEAPVNIRKTLYNTVQKYGSDFNSEESRFVQPSTFDFKSVPYLTTKTVLSFGLDNL